MAGKFKFDAQKFEEILKDYSSIINKTIPDCVALNARLLCVELARRTQPFGKKSESGIGRVEKDIGKIIKTNEKLDEMVAMVSTEKIRNRLQNLLKAKRYDVLKTILERIGFLNKWGGLEVTSNFQEVHKANRNARTGRTRNKGDKLYIAEGNLPAYIEDVTKRVGIAKSGWARCAEELPPVIGGSMTRGIPDWVASQTKGGGQVKNNLADTENPRVLMTNTVPWIDRICPASEQLKASQVVIAKMKKQMESILKKRTKTLTE
jgi:hypothetical protein